jgi:uncharacterized membrane protein
MSAQGNPLPPPDGAFGVRANRWALGLSRHWLRWVLLVIGIYVGLPFVAPTLMHFGLTGPGRALYTVYSPLCHQFAFRSFFLFGEQPAYPREAAHVPGLQPYEAFTTDINAAEGTATDLSQWTVDLELLSRDFVGNQRMGYKVALCERDISIYGTMFIAGLIFAIPYVRRHLRPVPLWLYVLLGLMPIAIDGFSQLLGYPPFNLWAARETTPFFRVLTGAAFGFMNAWLAFPYLEETAHQAVVELERKFARRRNRQTQQG